MTTRATTRGLVLSLAAAALLTAPAITSGQQEHYPVTIIAPGKGPFSFPPGYQTPWEKIDIRVTEKMSPNLFVLHGSQGLDPAHPDASGGRAMALFGADGVLLVDTENRQVAEKTLKAIRDPPTETAGLIAVIPDTPVNRLVSCVGVPPDRSTRYRLEMPW